MLIVIGSIAYDNLLDFPGKFSEHILPDQIHKINISFNVNHHKRYRGGTAGNLVYNLHLLNTPSILFSRAGNDFIEYKTAFNKLGIDTSMVMVDENDCTAVGFVLTDKSNNQIWGYSYGASSKLSELRLKTVAKKGDFVIIGSCGLKGIISFIRQCVDLNLPFMFDPNFVLADISNEDLEFGIANCNILISNEYEMSLIRNRLKNFNNLVVNKLIITTFGEKGVLINNKGKVYKIEAVPVKSIVDPTGAGDAWRAGFLAGIQRNYDLQICGQLGSVAASFAIEQSGTQERKYTKVQFQKRYRHVFGSSIPL